MEKFRYYMPTIIYFGRNEFDRVKKAASATGKNALIVIGKGSVKEHGYLQRLENCLKEEGIKFEVFEGIEPNPHSITINKAGAKAREMKADMIIALGGGSVMDASKGVAVVAKTGHDVWDYCSTRKRTAKKVSEALPLICIPTLAATGSEVDGAAVITNPQTKQKAVMHSCVVIPKYAVIDPTLTLTVPINYTIDGAVDIICHCLETYLTCKNKMCVPDHMTFAVTRSVKTAIERVIENPKDIDGREALSWASSLAMMGLFSGRDGGWPIHEIEHAISGLYDVSHGLGLALLMPAMMEFDKPHIQKKITRFVGYFLHENTEHYTSVDEAIQHFTKWLHQINAIRDLKGTKLDRVNKEAVADMVIDIYGHDDGYIWGIVPMYKGDIITILGKALHGTNDQARA